MNKLQQWKKAGIISLFLILTFIAGNTTEFSSKKQISQAQVLSAKIQTVPSPTLSSTPSAVPTTVPITIINNIVLPTQSPVVVSKASTLTSSPAQNPTVNTTNLVSPSPTVTSTSTQPEPTVTVSPTPTPTPTPISQTVEIDIDYAGQHAASSYTVAITAGETAWQAIQDAIGIANVQYTDYGGSLGIFITGFNGVSATSNQYYDFQVNGASSNVGVSSYIVNNHDVLKFILTNS